MNLKAISLSKFIWAFIFLQVLVNLTFLATRISNPIMFDNYLAVVKYSTIILLVLSLIIVFFQKQIIFNYDLLKYIFAAQILILYFTMIIHTDIKAINSPTIILMLLSSLIIFSNKITPNSINIFTLVVSYINFIIVLLQALNYIPVAQDNIREGLNIITDRPTGLLFNAFAMGYASVITFSISLFFIKEKKLIVLNVLGVLFSFISVVLSFTRTPLLLIAISGILILFQNTSLANKHWKLISISMPALLIVFPLVSVLVGNSNGNQDLATLNGRTFLWNCVTSKWDQFVPFGVGVQGAFPQGFCSDDEWFSKLRHPENMFLLNFVESGIIGIVGLVLLFVITFWFSGKALQRGSGLPMAITSTFLLSSIFYVPLFHYLPFLENRTADRGVFNFFLFTLLWMAVLKLFSAETTMQKAKTS
jgi:O-antigen ligase